MEGERIGKNVREAFLLPAQNAVSYVHAQARSPALRLLFPVLRTESNLPEDSLGFQAGFSRLSFLGFLRLYGESSITWSWIILEELRRISGSVRKLRNVAQNVLGFYLGTNALYLGQGPDLGPSFVIIR